MTNPGEDRAVSARIEKRRIEVVNTIPAINADGQQVGVFETRAVDYIPAELAPSHAAFLRQFNAQVTVGDEHDPGPGGDDGATAIPSHLADEAQQHPHLAALPVIGD